MILHKIKTCNHLLNWEDQKEKDKDQQLKKDFHIKSKQYSMILKFM